MSRPTCRALWAAMDVGEPDMLYDLFLPGMPVEILFDDRMPFGASKLGEGYGDCGEIGHPRGSHFCRSGDVPHPPEVFKGAGSGQAS